MKKTLKLSEIVKSPNVAVLMAKEDLDELGTTVVDKFDQDMQSRSEWEQRNAKAIELALQVVKIKNFPWTNCSNVKFPLLTIAALQFLARISLLTKGRNLVKLEALGKDTTGEKFAQAQRIATHMNLQLLEEDENWIDSDEKAKLAAAILGCAIKKSYYDQVSGTVISEYVPAMNFVVDYYCKDLNKAARVTHVLYMSANKVQERVRGGLFVEMLDDVPGQTTTMLLRTTADDAEGIKSPEASSSGVYEVLEQHCWVDLDGDGYEEPYVVSVRKDTKQVLRVVARFFDIGDVHRKYDAEVRKLEEMAKLMEQPADQSRYEKEAERLAAAKDNHILRIDPVLYFTKIPFIPSPDDGFYGLGLGSLLGPLNESVNTLVNQLIDSGTMSNSAGGFLGRGVRLKGGKSTFDPFEWKPVDGSGDDLRKNIVPLPTKDPSAVLFQLLGLLVQYGEKLSGATDIMTGVAPGQNTPAETSRNTVEQGMMLFSGIYARMYRAFRSELKKVYRLNQLFLETSPRWRDLTTGVDAILSADDYKSGLFHVYPVADSAAVSATQQKEKAATLLQLAMSDPGFNRYLVTKNFLEAHDYANIDAIYPDPKGPNALPPPQNPKIELEKMKLQQQQQEHQDEMSLAVIELKKDAELNQAKIAELQARATQHLAQAEGVDTGHQIALIEAQIGAAKHKQDGLLAAIAMLQKASDSHMKSQPTGGNSNGNATRSAGVVPQPGDAGAAAAPQGV